MERNRNTKLVSQLRRIRFSKSKLHHVLGEFIDNSISSYYKGNNKDPIDKGFDVTGLEIKIVFTKYGFYFIDNSVGMKLETLRNGLKFYNPELNIRRTGLNQYGVGLKDAAFHIGEWLTIVTKHQNDKADHVNISEINITGRADDDDASQETKQYSFNEAKRKLVLDAKQLVALEQDSRIKLFDEFDFFRKNLNQKGTGTLIIVRTLYIDDAAFIEEQLKYLDKILTWKYSNYFKNGMKMNVYQNLNEPTDSSFEIKHQFSLDKTSTYDIDYEVITETLSDLRNSELIKNNLEADKNYEVPSLKGFVKYLSESTIDDEIRHSKIKYSSGDTSFKKRVENFILEATKVVESGRTNKLVSKFEYEIRDEDGMMTGLIYGEIGYLSTKLSHHSSDYSFNKYNGFIVSQYGRALVSGPNPTINMEYESKNWIPLNELSGENQSEAWRRRKTGQIFLDKANLDKNILSIRVDKNKKGFVFTNPKNNLDFVNFLRNEFKYMDVLMKAFHDYKNSFEYIGETWPTSKFLKSNFLKKINIENSWAKSSDRANDFIKNKKYSIFELLNIRGTRVLEIFILANNVETNRFVEDELIDTSNGKVILLQSFIRNWVWGSLFDAEGISLDDSNKVENILKLTILLSLTNFLFITNTSEKIKEHFSTFFQKYDVQTNIKDFITMISKEVIDE